MTKASIEDSIKNTVAKQLEPLFKRAKEEGLWFCCRYQNIWLSPNELRKSQERGELIWGAQNWKLKDPTIYLEQLKMKLNKQKKRLNIFHPGPSKQATTIG